MRVAIAHYNRLKNDGFGLYVEELRKTLKADILISNKSEWSGDKKFGGLRAWIPMKTPLDSYYARKLDEEYDALWLNWLVWSCFGPIALKMKKCKLILDYHGLTPEKHMKNWIYKMMISKARELNKELVRKASIIITHSRFTMKELGVRNANVLPLPVYERKPSNAKKKGEYLLYVGRITPHKRLDVIIKALKKVNRKLVIIGDYERNPLYRTEKARLERLAKELGVNAEFTGEVADNRLNDYYRKAYAFVTASEHEGFCSPVIEAMSQGTPVIGARASALTETIGSSGLLFTPGDSNDLTRKIKSLEGRYEELVSKGLVKARAHSPEVFKKNVSRLIHKL